MSTENNVISAALDQVKVRDEIRALIETLPSEQRLEVAQRCEELLAWIKARGVTGLLAFSFVGASMAAEAEDQ